jgi:hypothetical protein
LNWPPNALRVDAFKDVPGWYRLFRGIHDLQHNQQFVLALGIKKLCTLQFFVQFQQIFFALILLSIKGAGVIGSKSSKRISLSGYTR